MRGHVKPAIEELDRKAEDLREAIDRGSDLGLNTMPLSTELTRVLCELENLNKWIHRR